MTFGRRAAWTLYPRVSLIYAESSPCDETLAFKTIIPPIETNNHREDATNMSAFGAQPAQPSGGLFGRVAAPNQPATGSPFGNNNPTQNNPPASSVFGGAQPQTATGSGMFGNLNTGTNPAPSQPSPFGAPQPAAAASTNTPSPFAALNGTNATQGASSSTNNLFSGLGGNQQTQQQQTGGGLFGGLGTNSNQQQQPSQPGTSVFGASSLANNGTATNQQQAQPQNEPSSSLAGGSTTGALFDHLIERGRKRQGPDASRVQFDELPSLQLGLGDIASKVRNLGSGLSRSAAKGDSRAYVFHPFHPLS